jgi:hypothetical protein
MKAIKLPSTITVQLGLGLLAVGVGYLLLRKGLDVGGGLVTGNNAITRRATNADNERITAYEGAGVLGTLGAATNAVSGGYLATFGQWLGDKAYDLLNPAPSAPPLTPRTPAGHTAYWKS